MVDIRGIDQMTRSQIAEEVRRGGKFVYFEYCFSIVILTFKQSTDIYFIRSGESQLRYHWPYTLLSLMLGWWGFPWGFIYTPMALYTNFSGGKDVTAVVTRPSVPAS